MSALCQHRQPRTSSIMGDTAHDMHDIDIWKYTVFTSSYASPCAKSTKHTISFAAAKNINARVLGWLTETRGLAILT